MLSYPQHIVDVEKKSDDEVYIIMKSGKKIIYDDKKEKNHEVKLTNLDLQDMLEQDYPLEKIQRSWIKILILVELDITSY